jgi:hypothetical protein
VIRFLVPFALAAFSGPIVTSAADLPLVQGAVAAVSRHPAVLLVDRGRIAGISIGDRVVIDDGEHPTAVAEIILANDAFSGARYLAAGDGPRPGQRATVIPRTLGRREPGDLPAGVYRIARIDGVLPGGDRVWIDGGLVQGWQEDDAVLLEHGPTSFRRGQIVLSDLNLSLVALDPDGGDLPPPDRTDLIRQIRPGPAPIATQVPVAGVEHIDDRPTVVLAGGAGSGLTIGDRLDLFRADHYVGFAKVTAIEPRVLAEVWESLSRETPEPGDRAVPRAKRDAPGRRTGRIFRVENDYALITIGEDDGIRLGDGLVCEQGAATAIHLVVDRLYPDHCGARCVRGPDQPNTALPLWAEIHNARPQIDLDRDRRRDLHPTYQERVLPIADWLYEVVPAPGDELQIGELAAVGGAARMVGMAAARLGQHVLVVRIDGLRR